jgi:anhydro-N-acetylmuramic acid kinase
MITLRGVAWPDDPDLGRTFYTAGLMHGGIAPNVIPPEAELAKRGEINGALLKRINKVYDKIRNGRPSLGREFFEKQIQQLLDNENCSFHDKLRTFTEASAIEINNVFNSLPRNSSILITGGGTFNSFLIYRLIELCADHVSLVIPDEEIVKFKEALVFAFLGVLRVEGEINCLKSVTGATKDSSTGVVVGAIK